MRKRRCVDGGCWIVMIALLCLFPHHTLRASDPASQAGRFRLPLRTQVQPFRGSNAWEAARFEREFSTRETAIVICDLWDNHWCAGATRRVNELAHKMEPVLEVCRAAGILIVHAPSDTMDFYKDYPQRRAMQLLTPVTPPASLGLTSPALPIDDSDGGCDTPGDKEHTAWMRENPLLSVKANDVISDNGGEIYTLLQQKGIKNLFVMGVHANMCILNRTFAIKQMTNWGITCVLVRDLTDAMYNPRSRPYVSHAEGAELVIEYIEKYWCPTALSGDLVNALKK
ncbi:MAG: isochorismatase [Terriglobia bacterium]